MNTPTPSPLLVKLLEDPATGKPWYETPVGLLVVGFIITVLTALLTGFLERRKAANDREITRLQTVADRQDALDQANKDRERLESREDFLRWLPELVKATASFSNSAQDCFDAHGEVFVAKTELAAADPTTRPDKTKLRDAANAKWVETYQTNVDARVNVSFLAPDEVYKKARQITKMLWDFDLENPKDRDVLIAQSDQLREAKEEFAQLTRSYVHKGERR